LSQHFVTRGKVKIAYDRRGDGPPVVLVQGLGMNGGMWLALAGGLVKSGFKVVVPDNRGTGASDAPRPPYRMRELADDLAAVLEDSGVGPALVVGISLGGMIAQHLALRHPAQVGGMVLAATTCGPPVGNLPRVGFIPLMLRSLLGDRRALRPLRLWLVHERSLERNPEIFAAWDREARRQPTPWSGLMGQLAAAAGHSTGFQLGRIRCPVEVIAGSDDRIIPPESARILARRIPGAHLTVVPDAGHAFPLEAPRALPEAIGRVQARITELQSARAGTV